MYVVVKSVDGRIFIYNHKDRSFSDVEKICTRSRDDKKNERNNTKGKQRIN